MTNLSKMKMTSLFQQKYQHWPPKLVCLVCPPHEQEASLTLRLVSASITFKTNISVTEDNLTKRI